MKRERHQFKTSNFGHPMKYEFFFQGITLIKISKGKGSFLINQITVLLSGSIILEFVSPNEAFLHKRISQSLQSFVP